MGYVQSQCPECKSKFNDSSNTWNYGSPIRVCPKCRAEYLDKRFREVAITGFDPHSSNPKYYLKCCLILIALAAAGGAWFYWKLMFRNVISISGGAIAAISVIGMFWCFAQFVRIKTGAQQKANQKYMAESEERLKDKAYVKKLFAAGYKVPEKYL